MTIINEQYEEHAAYLTLLYDQARARTGRHLQIYNDVRAMLDRLQLEGTSDHVTDDEYNNLCSELRSMR